MPIDLQRWAPSGDIYERIADAYGEDGANVVYEAAKSGLKWKVSEALANLKLGPPRNNSTASLLWYQIGHDPLLAPLQSAMTNRLIATGSVLVGGWFTYSAVAKGNYVPALLIALSTLATIKWLDSQKL